MIATETLNGGSLHAVVRRWEELGKRGVTVSICFGQCGDMGMLYSVDALGPDGQTFDKPFGAVTLEQAVDIAEKESAERGWIAPNEKAQVLRAGSGASEHSEDSSL